MSLSGASTVKDETGKIVYRVKGNFFSNKISRTHKKTIVDENKKKLFFVKNKFWHRIGHKSAKIYNSKKKIIAIVEESHLFKNGYKVKGATLPIKVEGQGWNLDIIMGDKIIGHIAPPENMKLMDAYTLEVVDKDDEAFLVSLVIAIDNCHDQNKTQS